jgi:hypothetical protein
MPKRKEAGAVSSDEQSFRAACKEYLDQRWDAVTAAFVSAAPSQPPDPLSEDLELIDLIDACLTSKSKSYHYVLPTHLLAKCVNPALDCHSIQVSYGGSGAFDARSLAHAVTVPFDQANFCVLGGSMEPYANNPLRIPGVTAAFRSAQKQHQDWDRLIRVLDTVENADEPQFARKVFDQVLYETHKLLTDVKVIYPTPSRIGLANVYDLASRYLAHRSGGERMEVVCTALFQTMAGRFGIFDEVRRERVNAADQSSGMTADIECWLDGKIVLLVEVKDRMLTLIQLNAKLDRARSQQIKEILFIAQQEKQSAEAEQISIRIASEFVSGQNVYVAGFNDFSLGVFILFGEGGRADFLRAVGDELDRTGSAIHHRRAWAELLRSI